MPFLAIEDSLISENVTCLTEPVAPEMVLIRMPLSEFVTSELVMVTFLTSLLSRPPTDPMLRPWPPEQEPPVKRMF